MVLVVYGKSKSKNCLFKIQGLNFGLIKTALNFLNKLLINFAPKARSPTFIGSWEYSSTFTKRDNNDWIIFFTNGPGNSARMEGMIFSVLICDWVFWLFYRGAIWVFVIGTGNIENRYLAVSNRFWASIWCYKLCLTQHSFKYICPITTTII